MGKSWKPAAGSLVGTSWIELGEIAGPAIAITDSDGRFRISVRFRPGNDMPPIGKACTEQLGRINVIAYAGGQRSYPTQFTVTGLKQELPSIRISEPAASPWE